MTVVWSGVDGIAGTTDDVTITTTTAIDGSCLVPGLPHGDYVVQVDDRDLPQASTTRRMTTTPS